MARCEECIHERLCVIKAFPDAFENTEWNKDPCDHLMPTADVVPRAEVDRLNKELDELAEEYSDLIVEKDQLFDIADKQSIEIVALKIANKKMYSAIEGIKAEVAREIFEEIEREITDALKSNYKVLPLIEQSEALWNNVNGKINALRGIEYFIEELKEKYTEDSK